MVFALRTSTSPIPNQNASLRKVRHRFGERGLCGGCLEQSVFAFSPPDADSKHLAFAYGCCSKHRYENGTLVSGNMDQSLRFAPPILILSHIMNRPHPTMQMSPFILSDNMSGLWEVAPLPKCGPHKKSTPVYSSGVSPNFWGF